MAKTPEIPMTSRLNSEESAKSAIKKLERRIAELSSFDTHQIPEGNYSATASLLSNSVEETLDQAFGMGSIEQQRYKRASAFFPSYWHNKPHSKFVLEFAENINGSIQILKGAIKAIEDRLTDGDFAPAQQASTSPAERSKQKISNKVFIVHGHDEAAKLNIARFLESIHLTPIVLHEQANQGATVIEKFERNSDVEFAIVILSPDDEGYKIDHQPQKRARQNVILELGFFFGKLGRKRVMVFKTGEIELPSDFLGIVYEPFDLNDGWKLKLGKELKASGYSVDLNQII